MDSVPAPQAPVGSTRRHGLPRLSLTTPWLSRTGLACLMILVASFGAAIAYWIAHNEQDSARLHRELTLGQMLELSIRQETVGDVGYRALLEERQRNHDIQALSFMDAAKRLRAADPLQAREYDYRAQQELLQWYFVASLLVSLASVDTGPGMSARLDDEINARLMRQGFYKGPTSLDERPAGTSPAAPTSTPAPTLPPSPTSATAPAAKPAAETGSTPTLDHQDAETTYEGIVEHARLPTWQRVYREIHGLHDHVPLLALSVVFFVGGLVCMTISDLIYTRPVWSNLILALGALSTLGALASAFIWDFSVWAPMFVVALGGMLVGLAFWILGVFRFQLLQPSAETHEVEPKQVPFAHLVLHHGHTLRERMDVMLIAVTVLLSSVVGYWYASAQVQADLASDRAFESELRLNNLSGERWVSGTATRLTPALALLSQRLRCELASQQLVLLPQGASAEARDSADRTRAADCKELDTDHAAELGKLLDTVHFDTAAAPGSALVTGSRYSGGANPAQLFALADGYIAQAEVWEGRSAVYLLGLTVFAIALYLLGQSLGMDTDMPSLVLAASGVTFAVGTFAYVARVHWKPVDQPVHIAQGPCKATGDAVEVAAAFYGQARALYDSADTGDAYRQAAEAFGCALTVRPDFARAQYERSFADTYIGQNDVGSSYYNFPTKDRMPEIYASLEKTAEVLDHGGWTPTPRMLNSRGFNAELLAFTSADVSLVGKAIESFKASISGAGFLGADGKPDKKKTEQLKPSDRDLYAMIYTNLGLGYLANDDAAHAVEAYGIALEHFALAKNPPLVASSLSDLNTLDGYCHQLSHDAERCKRTYARIVDVRRMLLLGRAGPIKPVPTTLTVTDFDTWVRPARVGWRARIHNFDPKRDSLHVVWSEFSGDWNVWRVVQPLFEAVDPAKISAQGLSESSTFYSADTASCLPPGRYRAEVFLNGTALVGGRELEVGKYEDYRSRETNFALCKPEGWSESSFRQNGEGRHLIRAFTNASGSATAYLFTFFAPREEFHPIEYDSKAWLLLKRWAQNMPNDERFSAAFNKFHGCAEPVPQGTVLHREWVDGTGMAFVAFVLGNSAQNDEACNVLESIGNYYGRDQRSLEDVFKARPAAPASGGSH